MRKIRYYKSDRGVIIEKKIGMTSVVYSSANPYGIEKEMNILKIEEDVDYNSLSPEEALDIIKGFQEGEYRKEKRKDAQQRIAFSIAEKAHSGQVDKAGQPYILHPIKVHFLAMGDYKVKTAALLHDVIEDSDYTADDLIREGIEPKIVDAVTLLTHDKNEPYLEYVRRVKKNPIAKAVKMADLKHNMDLSRLDDPTDEDYQRIGKYREAYAILTGVRQ